MTGRGDGRVLVAYADGPGSPRTAPADAIAAAGLTGRPEVLLGWTLERHPWLSDPELCGRTVLGGYALAAPIAEGRIVPLAIRLSAVARVLADDPPAVGVVTGVPRGAGYAFGASVGWADVLARVARHLVVEVDADAPDLGAPSIDAPITATVPRPPADAAGVASRPPDAIDLRIGELVADLVPDEATVQFGPGGVSNGIARALRRPVHVWSGLVDDDTAGLADRGLLASPAVAAYAWGDDAVVRLARADGLRLVPASTTHDLTALSAIPRLVACNTALQVGLDGSVGIERVGDRAIAAIGGHADFCVGASRSPGGLSIVALHATAGGRSTIVPRVDVVSTQRSDVDVVVTEHGVADLRGLGDADRSDRLRAIAAPEHRAALTAT